MNVDNDDKTESKNEDGMNSVEQRKPTAICIECGLKDMGYTPTERILLPELTSVKFYTIRLGTTGTSEVLAYADVCADCWHAWGLE